ncbi:DnaJ subfamily C member 3 [Fasciolopsis buskii]|uniref:DnaJ subfamily C member 3 n=1 Tax=Fasciolopsis buskii TaxID=27845 RepID=A0A8E0S3S0_9TREM|nr:DnaJ subfamily C member 3 [Fasciolopsis buski]
MSCLPGSVSPSRVWNTILVYISTLAYLYIPDNLLVAASVEQLLEKGTRLMVGGQLNDALSVFMQAVDDDPENHLTYFRRGTAYFALGSVRLAYKDFTQSVSLNAGFRPAHDDPEAAAQLALIDDLEIKYNMAEKHFENKNYEDSLFLLNSLIDMMNFDHKLRQMRSKCYFEKGDIQKSDDSEAIPFCEVVNRLFPRNPDHQCDLAQAYISGDRFEDAIKMCQSVLDDDRQNQRARELLKRAQQLLKNSKRRDYYKILGVSRSASKPEILKAYRKLAAQWHPDKFDGKDKKAAETKFIEIAAAKDVLTDPKMRARYDNGEDPLDPSTQEPNQGPFGPFGGFSFANMHPFEGGHFEFHFG